MIVQLLQTIAGMGPMVMMPIIIFVRFLFYCSEFVPASFSIKFFLLRADKSTIL